ncbi:MAG: CbiX/SirB N-terminal domain-containing protein [Luteolibacter sp.]
MPIAPKPNSALLIVGHGSTENPDSSTPYFQYAEAIRRRNLFAEVHCCFWKEEPSFREAGYLIDSTDVYVVPAFISEGYFTQDIIPRELELTGPTTTVRGKTYHYCLPVGVHPSMTDLILRRAKEVAPGVPPEKTTLIITGHGTGLNQNSTKAIRDQVALIASSGAGYAAVLDAFMEEPPFIAKWDEMATTENVIVVPFFISDGLHSYQDIPVLLGIESEVGAAASQREVFRHNPYRLRGKTLYYSSAIGTEPHMADVILDQVHDFDHTHSIDPTLPGTAASTISGKLHTLLRQGFHRIGEIEIQQDVYGYPYLLCHHLDYDLSGEGGLGGLELHESPEKARDLSIYAPDGSYRFSKSQPNLSRGWVLGLQDEEALRQALDLFYPAALGLHFAHQEGALEVQDLRDKLNRQTGMYQRARNISDSGAQDLVRQVYGPDHVCAQKILWQLDAGAPLDNSEASRFNGMPPGFTHPAAIPLLSREASNHFVAECRKAASAEAKRASAS